MVTVDLSGMILQISRNQEKKMVIVTFEPSLKTERWIGRMASSDQRRLKVLQCSVPTALGAYILARNLSGDGAVGQCRYWW